jgi:hypothetical protein
MAADTTSLGLELVTYEIVLDTKLKALDADTYNQHAADLEQLIEAFLQNDAHPYITECDSMQCHTAKYCIDCKSTVYAKLSITLSHWADEKKPELSKPVFRKLFMANAQATFPNLTVAKKVLL